MDKIYQRGTGKIMYDGSPLYEVLDLHELYLKNYTGDPVCLFRADLKGGYFSGRNLRDISFCHANLSGANFAGAILVSSSFSHADLSGADFSGAFLRDADFEGANLDGAKFDGAYIEGAHFYGAFPESKTK